MQFHKIAWGLMSLYAVPFFVWAAHKNIEVLVPQEIKHKELSKSFALNFELECGEEWSELGHMMTWWGYPGTGAGDQKVTRDVIIIDRTQDLDLTPGESYVNTNKENILCPTQFWGTQILNLQFLNIHLQWQVHVHVRAMRNLFKANQHSFVNMMWVDVEFGIHLTTYRK